MVTARSPEVKNKARTNDMFTFIVKSICEYFQGMRELPAGSESALRSLLSRDQGNRLPVLSARSARKPLVKPLELKVLWSVTERKIRGSPC
jgi:hypothetical protein